MVFPLRGPRALVALAGAGLLAACQLSVDVTPIVPSPTPVRPSGSPAPTTSPEVTPVGTIAPSRPPGSAVPTPTRPPSGPPTPAVTPSTRPTPTPVSTPSSPGQTARPSTNPVPGQGQAKPGMVHEVIQLPLEGPYSVAVDPDGNLWVTTPNSEPALHKLAPDGKLIASYARRGGIDVGVDAQGRIWVAGTATHVLDRATGDILVSHDVWSSHLAIDPAGAVWTVSYSAEDLTKIVPGGTTETFSLAPRDWNGGLAVDPDGDVWVVGRKASNPENVQEILEVSPQGAIRKRYPVHAMGIAFSPDGRANVVLSNTARKLDKDGKPIASFQFGTDNPTFLDIAPDGHGRWLLVDNTHARLYRVSL